LDSLAMAQASDTSLQKDRRRLILALFFSRRKSWLIIRTIK
jgi:hypothetical protein